MTVDFRAMIWQSVRGKTLGRPVTLNSERNNGHWGQRRDTTAIWRRAARHTFTEALKAGEIRRLYIAKVQIVPRYLRGPLPDVGASAPTVKAIIDGMTEAGVIADDNPFHLESVLHLRPHLGTTDGIGVRVLEGDPIIGHDYATCRCEQVRLAQAAGSAKRKQAKR